MKLAVLVVFLAGCTLFHGDNRDHTRDGGTLSGDDGFGDDGCSGPGLPQALLLNPVTLACESHSLSSECNPSCQICDEDAGNAPWAHWASCNSSCLGLSETACGMTPGCRVTREAGHYFGTTVGDSFLGCFPDDNSNPLPEQCAVLDAEACSSLSRCNAVYDAPDGVQCGIERAEACPSGSFVMCVDQGATMPGRCGPDLTSTCVVSAPMCSSGTQPGINDSCYTGICIPQRYCTIPD